MQCAGVYPWGVPLEVSTTIYCRLMWCVEVVIGQQNSSRNRARSLQSFGRQEYQQLQEHSFLGVEILPAKVCWLFCLIVPQRFALSAAVSNLGAEYMQAQVFITRLPNGEKMWKKMYYLQIEHTVKNYSGSLSLRSQGLATGFFPDT